MKFDIIAVGGAVEDVIFYTKEGVVVDNHLDPLRPKLLAFEYGAKIRIDGIRTSCGGGAANAAVAMSRLGLKAGVLASLGLDDRGKKIIDNFRSQGVDLSLLKIKANKESGFSFVVIGPSSEHIVFSDRGANQDLNIESSDIKKLAKSKWLYLTSFSGDTWPKILQKTFSVKKVMIAWNPGTEQLRNFKVSKKYLAKTEILFLNHDEALDLAVAAGKKKDLPKFKDLKRLLSFLASLGPKKVVITNGARGAWGYDGQEYYFQPIVKEGRKVDTTGVGDAFNSSVVAGLELYQGDFKKSLFLAAHNAASLIALPGAQQGLLATKDLKVINKKFNKT